MKKKALTWLLILAMMVPLAAFAGGKAENDKHSEARALLNQVQTLGTIEEQVETISEAAELAWDSAEILADCGRLLFFLDGMDEYGEESERILRQALTLAEGETKVTVVQILTEQLLYAGRTDEAKTLASDALAGDADNDKLIVSLATTMAYAKESEAAQELVDEVVARDPEYLEARSLQAALYLDQYRWEDAMAAYKALETDFPDYLTGLIGQYNTYSCMGEFDRAARVLNTVISYDVDDRLWLERAQLRLWRQYRPADALSESLALLRMAPGWTDASVVKIISLVLLEEYDDAYLAASELEAYDPIYADYMRAIVEMNEGKWAKARNRLEKMVKDSPGLYSGWEKLANAYAGGYDDTTLAMEAMANAFAAVGQEGNFDLFLTLGDIYRRDGALLEAARAYTAADQLTWEDPTAMLRLAITYLDAGRAEDAEKTVLDMEKRYPGWQETMAARLTLEEQTGNEAAAVEAYDAWVDKYPFLTENTMIDSSVGVRAAAGEITAEEAEALLLPEGAENGNAETLDYCAYALVLLGELDRAEALLALANERMPQPRPETAGEDRVAAMSLCTTEVMLLAERGDIEGSVQALEKAVALGYSLHSLTLNPNNAPIYESDAFAALAAKYPVEEEWDLTVLPTIPMLQTEEKTDA